MTRLEVLEQRLAALETEVAELRIQIRSPGAEPPGARPWGGILHRRRPDGRSRRPRLAP